MDGEVMDGVLFVIDQLGRNVQALSAENEALRRRLAELEAERQSSS